MGPHLRAALLFLVYAVFGVLGTPGLNAIPDGKYDDPEFQQMFDEHPAGALGWLVVDFNHWVRAPVARTFAWVERPFRIAQEWNLYTAGPPLKHTLDVKVDDRLVFRAGSPEYTWQRDVLRYRRIRPMAESIAERKSPKNWVGFARLVVDRARADFPEARSVEILVTVGPYAGGVQQPKRRIVARAPDWKAKLVLDELRTDK